MKRGRTSRVTQLRSIGPRDAGAVLSVQSSRARMNRRGAIMARERTRQYRTDVVLAELQLTIALSRRLRRLAAGRWVGHPERVDRRTCRAWSVRCAYGAARHVSELVR
jgi:hypothetical protein